MRNLTDKNHNKETNSKAKEYNLIENAIEIINSTMDQSEERICKVEDRNFEIIQSLENKEKE